jgi:hypothetical protein
MTALLRFRARKDPDLDFLHLGPNLDPVTYPDSGYTCTGR